MPLNSKIGAICVELLDGNLALLRGAEAGLKDELVVHELRVSTKRLRSAWKMVAEKIDPGLKTSRAEAMKEFSALLAGDRDLHVLETLSRELDLKYPEAGFSSVLTYLAENFEGDGESASPERVEAIMEAEKLAWGEVSFDSFAEEQNNHRRAIRSSLRKAREATHEAVQSKDAEVWHSWRKKVKNLRYQREFLAQIQGRIPGKWDLRISLLGSRLGDRNDLANLTEIAEKLGNPPLLRKAIAAEERDLLGNCRRLGRRNLLRK